MNLHCLLSAPPLIPPNFVSSSSFSASERGHGTFFARSIHLCSVAFPSEFPMHGKLITPTMKSRGVGPFSPRHLEWMLFLPSRRPLDRARCQTKRPGQVKRPRAGSEPTYTFVGPRSGPRPHSPHLSFGCASTDHDWGL